MSVPFWTEDPAILLNQNFIGELWCDDTMSSSQKLNAITRLVIVLSVVGWIMLQSTRFLLTGLLTLGALVGIRHYLLTTRSKASYDNVAQEGFSNMEFQKELEGGIEPPTASNPLMNVQVQQFGTSEREKPAAPSFNPTVEKDINNDVRKQIVELNPSIDNLDERIFKDLGDNFVFNQSMRNFYTMPNTNVPNNQKEFAEFCYGNMPSCKEQDPLACSKHTIRHINI